MKFFIFKAKQLPPAAQNGLLPRKEFLTQGKERFLAAFDASALAMNAHPARLSHVAIFLKIGVGVMAALCIAVGVSAYADTANVPVTSPLYPLKRLSENIQLALTPASEKARLQATFAVRRAEEIAALQVSAPSSTLIPKLTSDLNQDISSSLSVSAGFGENKNKNGGGRNNSDNTSNAIVATSSDDGPVSVYCKAFDVSTSGVFIGSLESSLTLHPEALARFNEQCGSESRVNNNSSSVKEQAGVVGQVGHERSYMDNNATSSSDTFLHSVDTRTPSPIDVRASGGF